MYHYYKNIEKIKKPITINVKGKYQNVKCCLFKLFTVIISITFYGICETLTFPEERLRILCCIAITVYCRVITVTGINMDKKENAQMVHVNINY